MNLALISLALAPTASVHSGRLPAHSQVQEAVAASRLCVDGNPEEPTLCQPVVTVTRDERCRPISVPRRDGNRYRGVLAGARCSFQYGQFIRVDVNSRPGRWIRDHADFFLVGSPCGEEGQEEDLTCYSWTTAREPN